MHNDAVCPKYNEPVLPDENGKCFLCGATITGEVYFCELCRNAYEPEQVNGVNTLKQFQGYTVDLRLQEFRKTEFGELPEFIAFASPEGSALLSQMHEKAMKHAREKLNELVKRLDTSFEKFLEKVMQKRN